MVSDGAPPVALTIAGSDSGGGAGVQADLRTFAAHRVHGTSAITAVTAQNTVGVQLVHLIPPDVVAAQVQAVLDDLGVGGVKTGFLAAAEVVRVVAEVAEAGLLSNLVVDPVLVNSSGVQIVSDETVAAYRTSLLPAALVVTPNAAEAALLTGVEVTDPPSMAAAARQLGALGPRAVVVKGGGLRSGDAVDVLWHTGEITELREGRIATPNDHGTGCSLAAATAAGLARGLTVVEAVPAAKRFVTRAIAGAAAWRMGSGHGPIDHLGWSEETR